MHYLFLFIFSNSNVPDSKHSEVQFVLGISASSKSSSEDHSSPSEIRVRRYRKKLGSATNEVGGNKIFTLILTPFIHYTSRDCFRCALFGLQNTIDQKRSNFAQEDSSTFSENTFIKKIRIYYDECAFLMLY